MESFKRKIGELTGNNDCDLHVFYQMDDSRFIQGSKHKWNTLSKHRDKYKYA